MGVGNDGVVEAGEREDVTEWRRQRISGVGGGVAADDVDVDTVNGDSPCAPDMAGRIMVESRCVCVLGDMTILPARDVACGDMTSDPARDRVTSARLSARMCMVGGAVVPSTGSGSPSLCVCRRYTNCTPQGETRSSS